MACRTTYLGLLACLAAFSAGSENAGCPPNSHADSEDDTTVFCVCDAGFIKRAGACQRQSQGADSAEITKNFCAAKLKLAADERAIGEMNFANDTRSFEMFADISAQQKATLQKRVLDALLDQGFEATIMAANSAKALNPFNVNTTLKKLRAKGLNNDAIFAGLRRIAATPDKAHMAAAYKNLVQVVKNAKEGYDTAEGMAQDAENANLRLLLGVLKVAQGNPELGLAVTAVDFGESLAYLGYITVQVDDLTQVTDNKLVLLQRRINRLKQDVTSANAAKQDWAAASGKSGAPDCPT